MCFVPDWEIYRCSGEAMKLSEDVDGRIHLPILRPAVVEMDPKCVSARDIC